MSLLWVYRWKRPARLLKIAAFAAAIALLASCGDDKNGVNANAKAGSAGPGVSVVVAPVVQKTVPIFTELTARIDATDSVDIRARVKSYLLKQSYDEGKMVKAGQVLFSLDKREYEAQLMQAKAQLAKAQSDLTQAQDRTVVDVAQANLQIAMAQLNKTNQDVNRLKPLAALRAVPQQDYDDALAAQQAAKADVEGKQASLNTTKVNQTAAVQQAQNLVHGNLSRTDQLIDGEGVVFERLAGGVTEQQSLAHRRTGLLPHHCGGRLKFALRCGKFLHPRQIRGNAAGQHDQRRARVGAGLYFMGFKHGVSSHRE